MGAYGALTSFSSKPSTKGAQVSVGTRLNMRVTGPGASCISNGLPSFIHLRGDLDGTV